MRTSVVVAEQQPLPLEGIQPPRHRPDAPAVVEDPCVAHDVVEVLDGRVLHRMVLVIGAGVADPGETDTSFPGGEAEIRVLAAVAGVALEEAADTVPGVRVHGERERPEQVVGASENHLAGPGRRARGMRAIQRGEAVERIPTRRRGIEVGDRTAEQAALRGRRDGGSRVGAEKARRGQAVHVEEDEHLRPASQCGARAPVSGPGQRERSCRGRRHDADALAVESAEAADRRIVHGHDDVVVGARFRAVQRVELALEVLVAAVHDGDEGGPGHRCAPVETTPSVAVAAGAVALRAVARMAAAALAAPEPSFQPAQEPPS